MTGDELKAHRKRRGLWRLALAALPRFLPGQNPTRGAQRRRSPATVDFTGESTRNPPATASIETRLIYKLLRRKRGRPDRVLDQNNRIRRGSQFGKIHPLASTPRNPLRHRLRADT
jgi:hypothetical protein